MAQEDRLASLLLEAWQGRLGLISLIEHCNRFEAEAQLPLSAILYQTWLRRSVSPQQHVVWFNLGANLAALDDLPGAEDAYRRAIAIAPGFVQPRLNLGLVLERQGRPDEAVEVWSSVERALPADTDEHRAFLIMALNHLGRVLEGRRQYAEAARCLSRSLGIDPAQDDALHHLVFLRLKQCCWPVYEPFAAVSAERMRSATSALAMIAVTDDPAEQLAAARRFIAKKVRTDLPALAPAHSYGHRRLRIGYCSSDFCLHPVSMLMVELFELHDRRLVEVYGYCWSPEDGSALRQRVIASMDHFHRIDRLDDEAAAQLIRSHEIDILVDLQGQTAGARMDLIMRRPAPIQITYLGLPATTGLPAIDYVIADRFLIPPEEAQHYSEQPLYMPDVYQVSDRHRVLGRVPSRAECGLPEDAFVFCSFNNNFKFTPEVFASWMNILRRVPHGVLWLLSDNPWAEANLRAAATAAGIDPARLLFAGRVAPENYLSRFVVADLFLDTFPFNAGTTANDALWSGLPVLTRSGRTFAARMAGALLHAARLPELVTWNHADYEDRAVALAHDPEACRRLRLHLANERAEGRLFDTQRFARHFEQALLGLAAALPRAATVPT